MSESELTKEIKRLTHTFNPKLSSKMRTIRFADEVWTPSGIVDSIRFEDYYRTEKFGCKLDDCFREKKLPNNCRGCIHATHEYTIGMMITCFEVKITVSDFKSENGHNFHGNENYYAVPKEIVKKIEPLVPDGIGILSFNGNRLRTVKKPQWRDIDFELKTMLIYNAMKKWCDGTQENKNTGKCY